MPGQRGRVGGDGGAARLGSRIRSWWGEGSVIASQLPAPSRAAKEAGATPPRAQQRSGSGTSGRAVDRQHARKRRICPQQIRQAALSSGSQSLREASGWRLGTSKPLEFCRNRTRQSNTKTPPPPPEAASPIHYSSNIHQSLTTRSLGLVSTFAIFFSLDTPLPIHLSSPWHPRSESILEPHTRA